MGNWTSESKNNTDFIQDYASNILDLPHKHLVLKKVKYIF